MAVKNPFYDNKQRNNRMERIDNYLFAPSWIKISENEVTMEYWGTKVNSSFEKVFKRVDGAWKEEE